MKTKFLKLSKVYLPITLFILGWWILAFRETTSSLISSHNAFEEPSSQLNIEIKEMPNRQKIVQALAGDLRMMAELIIAFDVDAQIFQEGGFHSIQRIKTSTLLRSHKIQRTLCSHSKNISNERPQTLVDDIGCVISLKRTYQKFLPQTYTATSFLLSLTPPETIVAMPSFLRKQVELYPKMLTDQIHMDIDRYNAEKIYLQHPDIAFVAHYSHPAVVQAFANQGMHIYTMRDCLTINDICEELKNVGHLINRSLEAELLSIFIEATMVHLDNLVNVSYTHRESSFLPKVLFLNYYGNFFSPTKKSLTGQLLQRLKKWDLFYDVKEPDDTLEWMISIDQENMMHLNPSHLIVTIENADKNFIMNYLKFIDRSQVYFLDGTVQQSSSQYIVLAYYDIVETLLKIFKDEKNNF